jgi:dipeptidyl aminopeptidase/acylaminoacyl peptidase
VAPRSRRVAFVHRFRDINVWGVHPDGSGKRQAIASTAEDMSPDFSPDGSRIAFRSNRSGSMEIWVSGRDGSHAVRLTHFQGAQVRGPRWSPDGESIIFAVAPTGKMELYLVPVGGGPVRRLFESLCNVDTPSWSRDGGSIYYAAECGGTTQIRRRPVTGGGETILTRSGGTAPVENADGFIYYFRPGAHSGIWRVPRGGGSEEPVYPGMSDNLWGNWALAPGGLYHVRYGGITSPSILQFFDFQSRSDRDVTVFAEQPVLWISSLAVAPDAGEILFSQLDRAGADIMLLNQVR